MPWDLEWPSKSIKMGRETTETEIKHEKPFGEHEKPWCSANGHIVVELRGFYVAHATAFVLEALLIKQQDVSSFTFQ